MLLKEESMSANRDSDKGEVRVIDSEVMKEYSEMVDVPIVREDKECDYTNEPILNSLVQSQKAIVKLSVRSHLEV